MQVLEEALALNHLALVWLLNAIGLGSVRRRVNNTAGNTHYTASDLDERRLIRNRNRSEV